MSLENDYIKLKSGDRITLRNGDVLSYDDYYDKITNKEDSRTKYDRNLRHKDRRELDIIEVKRPIEYTTIFTEEDIEEDDDELDIDDVIDEIENKLTYDLFEDVELKKGNVIHLTINL